VTASTSQSSSVNIAAVAGGSAAGGSLLVLIIGLIIFLLLRKKKGKGIVPVISMAQPIDGHGEFGANPTKESHTGDPLGLYSEFFRAASRKS
jgi:hypothetical protein